MPGIDEFFERVASLRRDGAAFAIATVVSRQAPVSSQLGDRAIVFADGRMEGFVGGSCSREVVRRQALDVLAAGRPRLVSIRPDADAATPAEDAVHVPMSCGSNGAVDVYIEPFVPARTVVVVGLTPVAEALVRLATTLEYHVVRAVARDEQRDLGSAAPHVVAVDELDGYLSALPEPTRARLAAIVASQGHYDEPALEAALRADIGYVGLVASRRRGAEVLDMLAGAGIAEAALATLHAPAGLDLGARHPAEVALSILGEMIELHPSPRAFGAVVATAHAAAAPTIAVDPVCGMEVAAVAGAPHAEHAGTAYFFCCGGCQERFTAAPATYVAARR